MAQLYGNIMTQWHDLYWQDDIAASFRKETVVFVEKEKIEIRLKRIH